MPGFTISSEDGKAINNTNPLPVKTIGGGSGGAQEVEIVHDSSGILQAIQDLAGGDSSNEIYADDVTVTDSAAALPDVPCAEVWLQSDSANTEDILIGNSTTQNFTLKPGDSITIRITNLNIVYAKTVLNTATLHYIARGPAGLPGGGSQPVPVQLTGSNVEQAWVIGQTVRGAVVTLPEIDISDAGDVYFVVMSTLDAAVRFFISTINARGVLQNTAKIDDGSGTLRDLRIDIPATPNRIYILKMPNGFYASKIAGGLFCYNGAASSGSVSVYIQKRGKV